jgi:hypothetical protein
MWSTLSTIALFVFFIIAFGGGKTFLEHRREMFKMKIDLVKARTEETLEKRLLLEAEERTAPQNVQ